MANHRVPTRATEVERLFGLDVDGNVVVCVVYRHRRQGNEHSMYYQVQYREVDRRMQRGSRVTREMSGVRSRELMER